MSEAAVLWPWPDDRARIEHTRIRLLMLRGCWEQPLSEYLSLVWSQTRAAAQATTVDLSGNLVSAYARQLSQPGLYGTRPTIYGPNPSLIGRGGLLDDAMWPSFMQGVEYFARGAGCSAVVPSVRLTRQQHPTGPISFRRVDPDRLYIESIGSRPLEPTRLWEQVAYRVPRHGGLPASMESARGRVINCWDYYDITDRDQPVYKVLSPDLKDDITEMAFAGVPGADPVPEGGYVGDAYRWRYTSGEPYIPHTFYRERATDFWGIDFLRGAHRSSFTSARLASNALQVADNAAFGAAIGVNLDIPSAKQTAYNGATLSTIELPPGSLVLAETVDGAQPAQILQLAAAANPRDMMAVVGSFEERAIAALGLQQDEVTRDLANPTSAAALSLRDGTRRQAQIQAASVFRSSDLELLRKVTAMLIRQGVEGLEDGVVGQKYAIQYHPIEISGDAATAKREDVEWRVTRGFMSRVDGYMALNEGADRAAAIAALQQIAMDEALIQGAAAAQQADVRDRASELEEELSGVEDALRASEPDVQAAIEGIVEARRMLGEVDDASEEVERAPNA